MSALAWIAVALVAWFAVAVVVGLVIGRMAALNDRLGPKP